MYRLLRSVAALGWPPAPQGQPHDASSNPGTTGVPPVAPLPSGRSASLTGDDRDRYRAALSEVLFDSEALRRMRELIEDVAQDLHGGWWAMAQHDLAALDRNLHRLQKGMDTLAGGRLRPFDSGPTDLDEQDARVDRARW